MSIIFYGSTIEWGTNGTDYDPIPKAKGVAVPATTRNYVDVTNLDSPNSYREYIKGLRDISELSLVVGYTSEGYSQALTYSDEDDPLYIRVTFPLQTGQTTMGDVFVFRAFVEPEIPASDDVEAEVTFNLNMRVTGAPTFTEGS